MEFRRVLFRSRTVAPQAIGRKNTRMQGKRHEEPESPRIARLGQPVCWTGGHASEFRSQADVEGAATTRHRPQVAGRSEEHTSELQSLMRISYAVFCLKKKKNITRTTDNKLNHNSNE